MKKENRLTKNYDFQKIIDKKQSVANSTFVIYYQPNELPGSRIGLSASKKLGGAVQRNKCRRQLRSMVDQIMPYQKSLDYVIIIRNNFTKQSYLQNKESLAILIKKIHKQGVEYEKD